MVERRPTRTTFPPHRSNVNVNGRSTPRKEDKQGKGSYPSSMARDVPKCRSGASHKAFTQIEEKTYGFFSRLGDNGHGKWCVVIAHELPGSCAPSFGLDCFTLATAAVSPPALTRSDGMPCRTRRRRLIHGAAHTSTTGVAASPRPNGHSRGRRSDPRQLAPKERNRRLTRGQDVRPRRGVHWPSYGRSASAGRDPVRSPS